MITIIVSGGDDISIVSQSHQEEHGGAGMALMLSCY